ncbi:Lsr2 family protein [Actinomycetospora lutea]|uniref:histone-like nucleoid-structuring protein Lsr2 n=1 Tax=Actinomycetospora lutea TaxID=663604 RepID=UPI0023656AAD|nr:Lsr2 family protein [Actinomycetospora lutea]MDD7942018.1 Lsr2 family protein [Actinomycetospora lutea]
MAQRTIVTLLDDLDQSEADETVEFGLNGVSYEIDLTEKHAAGLRDALTDFVEHARRTGGRRRGSSTGVTGSSRARSGSRGGLGDRAGGATSIDREQNQAIRDWVRTQGMTISDRGRILRELTEAYHRAR